MKEYITFHQVTLDKENIGIKKLFGLNTNIHLGVEQFPGTFLRNPKNSNQIEIPENFSVVEREYSKFSNSDDAFETIKSCIYGEFKIDDSTFHRSNNTPPDLYFCFFDNEDEKPKFRGVLHATLTHMKPIYYVAFTKNLEYEYEKEVYKK